jgi:hypothetical protein
LKFGTPEGAPFGLSVDYGTGKMLEEMIDVAIDEVDLDQDILDLCLL